MKKLLVRVILIIAAGGSTYAQTTDFFELVQTGTSRSVHAAFSNGADVNAVDNDGRTSLMHAAERNQNPEMITALQRSGADAKAKDNAGKTAFDHAQDNESLKDTDLYRQLQKASR